MIPLKYNTASQEIPLGYFVDSTDGDTEETGLTIANTDIKLWKSGATTLANKNSGGATHISNGVYYCTLDATDTNTYGPLIIFVHVSGALTVRLECVVMEADAYDALYAASGTGHIEADAVQIEGADPTDQVNAACDTAISDASLATSAALAVVDSNVDAILLDTNELQTDDVPGLIAALNDISVADILTTQMTESYAADGTAPTLAQALFLVQQALTEFAISGTTLTIKKLDGSTTAATETLDDDTNPTSITRAT